MSDYIVIGQITRAVGIKGEVNVSPLTDDAVRFSSLRLVYIRKKPYKIANCRFSKNNVILKFVGVDDRNNAETLKDEFLEIDRVNAIPLQDGSYFIVDIVGCELFFEDGTQFGIITDVNQYGAADVFTAKCNGKIVRFPFLKKLAVNVDVENKKIIVRRSVFDEVCVYED